MRTCVCVCVLVYYKELLQATMEAKKPQDIQLASGRPRKVDGVVSVQG